MYQKTEYPMEELVALVGSLADRYTGKASSSVTYETAQILMEAVLYCLEEYRQSCMEENALLGADGGNALPLKDAYEQGYQLVLKKTGMARQLYQRILDHFEDFGCLNYRHTIKMGMPEFFRRYDARFRPQDHLLTLDYPTLGQTVGLCGVDVVYEYLQNIRLEGRFLAAFPSAAVERFLEEIQPEYQELFLDNICGAVLERALWCMLAERPAALLRLEKGDMEEVRGYFLSKEEAEAEAAGNLPEDDRSRLLGKAENRVRMLITRLADSVFKGNELLKEYLGCLSRELAVRMVCGTKKAD